MRPDPMRPDTQEDQQAGPETFSARLRQATKTDHTVAENSEFISSLMQGQRSAQDYIALLAQYQPIYLALEEAVARRRHSPEAALENDLFDSALDRSASLAQDLDALIDWAGFTQVPEVLPAARAYAARIAEAGEDHDAARLIAHHYLRYLGDLSGGQAIGTLVNRHYEVPREHLKMWHFAGVQKPKIYKDRYRELLDRCVGTEAEARIIQEASHGFQLNRDLFAQLAEASPLAALI